MFRNGQPWLAATVSTACLLSLLLSPIEATSSSKRGLIYISKTDHPSDNYIWPRQPSDLTWYYNYDSQPTQMYGNLSQANFEFVPMLWGAPSDSSDTTFLNTVKSLIEERGINISHVLSFNEPDGPAQYGGSDIDPSKAATVWVNNIIPLQNMGIRAGLPACTGGWGGLPWTRQFLGNCSKIISAGGKTKNCTFDFVTLHWYGNFEGLASHLGEWYGTFPNSKFWVTEYNLDNQDLQTTKSFFNTSAEYLDRLPYVERYSLFGAFRSSASNVGPNGAMLSAGGQLTDIGAWYLGRSATGVDPSSTSAAGFTTMSRFFVGVAAAFAIAVTVGF